MCPLMGFYVFYALTNVKCKDNMEAVKITVHFTKVGVQSTRVSLDILTQLNAELLNMQLLGNDIK